MTGDANDHISTLYNLTIEKDADRTFNSIRKSFFPSVLLLNELSVLLIQNYKWEKSFYLPLLSVLA